jgi:hypothetical protein
VSTRRPTVFPILAVLAIGPLSAGCGKKGPPLAPLRLVPAPVSEVTARRTGSDVLLRFVLPNKNQNGPGSVDLDRVEIYAVTVAPGAPVPANRDLMTKERLVGSVPVKPPPVEGEPLAPAGDADTRPSPGERVAFVEELTAEKLTPIKPPASTVPQPSAPEPAAPETAPLTTVAEVGAPRAPAPMPPPSATHPTRVYVIRGISTAGRPGPPAERVTIPVVEVPPAPTAVAVQPAERAYMLDWIPPVAEAGQSSIGFNIYSSGSEGAPLNQSPIAEAEFEHGPVRPGEEQCFVVSSVQVVQNVPIESQPSPPACTTWTDIYPPAAPKGLQAVAAEDGISLSWDASPEPDVAGYVVLRGEAPGDTLLPLTREPIRESNYRDTAVQSGARYVYAIVVLDKATPPNTSQQSQRQEVTAR